MFYGAVQECTYHAELQTFFKMSILCKKSVNRPRYTGERAFGSFSKIEEKNEELEGMVLNGGARGHHRCHVGKVAILKPRAVHAPLYRRQSQ